MGISFEAYIGSQNEICLEDIFDNNFYGILFEWNFRIFSQKYFLYIFKHLLASLVECQFAFLQDI